MHRHYSDTAYAPVKPSRLNPNSNLNLNLTLLQGVAGVGVGLGASNSAGAGSFLEAGSGSSVGFNEGIMKPSRGLPVGTIARGTVSMPTSPDMKKMGLGMNMGMGLGLALTAPVPAPGNDALSFQGPDEPQMQPDVQTPKFPRKQGAVEGQHAPNLPLWSMPHSAQSFFYPPQQDHGHGLGFGHGPIPDPPSSVAPMDITPTPTALQTDYQGLQGWYDPLVTEDRSKVFNGQLQRRPDEISPLRPGAGARMDVDSAPTDVLNLSPVPASVPPSAVTFGGYGRQPQRPINVNEGIYGVPVATGLAMSLRKPTETEIAANAEMDIDSPLGYDLNLGQAQGQGSMETKGRGEDDNDEYSASSEMVYDLGPGGRKKRAQVRIACTHCQRACKKCSNTRPCERCVKYGLNDCVDSTRKPRKTGIKRGPYKRRFSKLENYTYPPSALTNSDAPNGALSHAQAQTQAKASAAIQIRDGIVPPLGGYAHSSVLAATYESGGAGRHSQQGGVHPNQHTRATFAHLPGIGHSHPSIHSQQQTQSQESDTQSLIQGATNVGPDRTRSRPGLMGRRLSGLGPSYANSPNALNQGRPHPYAGRLNQTRRDPQPQLQPQSHTQAGPSTHQSTHANASNGSTESSGISTTVISGSEGDVSIDTERDILTHPAHLTSHAAHPHVITSYPPFPRAVLDPASTGDVAQARAAAGQSTGMGRNNDALTLTLTSMGESAGDPKGISGGEGDMQVEVEGGYNGVLFNDDLTTPAATSVLAQALSTALLTPQASWVDGQRLPSYSATSASNSNSGSSTATAFAGTAITFEELQAQQGQLSLPIHQPQVQTQTPNRSHGQMQAKAQLQMQGQKVRSNKTSQDGVQGQGQISVQGQIAPTGMGTVARIEGSTTGHIIRPLNPKKGRKDPQFRPRQRGPTGPSPLYPRTPVGRFPFSLGGGGDPFSRAVSPIKPLALSFPSSVTPSATSATAAATAAVSAFESIAGSAVSFGLRSTTLSSAQGRTIDGPEIVVSTTVIGTGTEDTNRRTGGLGKVREESEPLEEIGHLSHEIITSEDLGEAPIPSTTQLSLADQLANPSDPKPFSLVLPSKIKKPSLRTLISNSSVSSRTGSPTPTPTPGHGGATAREIPMPQEGSATMRSYMQQGPPSGIVTGSGIGIESGGGNGSGGASGAQMEVARTDSPALFGGMGMDMDVDDITFGDSAQGNKVSGEADNLNDEHDIEARRGIEGLFGGMLGTH